MRRHVDHAGRPGEGARRGPPRSIPRPELVGRLTNVIEPGAALPGGRGDQLVELGLRVGVVDEVEGPFVGRHGPNQKEPELDDWGVYSAGLLPPRPRAHRRPVELEQVFLVLLLDKHDAVLEQEDLQRDLLGALA